MRNFLFQYQSHKFFRWRRHGCEALTKRYNRKTHTLQVLRKLRCAPTVISNLPNVEPLSKLLNKLFDITVMHHISLCGLQKSLSLPDIIRNMIPLYPELQRFLRNPEITQHLVTVILIHRREHQGKCRQVCGTGKIQPAIAHTPLQLILIHRKTAGIPLLHRHPAHRLLHPLIQP